MSQHSQTGLHGSRLFVLAWIGVYPMVTLISWLFLWIPLIQRVERVRNSRRDGSGDGA